MPFKRKSGFLLLTFSFELNICLHQIWIAFCNFWSASYFTKRLSNDWRYAYQIGWQPDAARSLLLEECLGRSIDPIDMVEKKICTNLIFDWLQSCLIPSDNTHFIRGSITARLNSCLTDLDSTKKVNMLIILTQQAVKPEPVKQVFSHKIIIPLTRWVFSYSHTSYLKTVWPDWATFETFWSHFLLQN